MPPTPTFYTEDYHQQHLVKAVLLASRSSSPSGVRARRPTVSPKRQSGISQQARTNRAAA
jgi:hypothetical protein